MNQLLAVIIVTHDSRDVISASIDSLMHQHPFPHQVIIIDSGSDDATYLEPFMQMERFSVHVRDNIGFAAANNIGLGCVDDHVEYVLFINPDTFLAENCLETALAVLSGKPKTAMLTGILKGYDVKNQCPNGLIDSTGIFRTWYGRWYDRGQGQRETASFRAEEEVPAVCGAFMLCRKQALMSVIENRTELFDESFFMYKEDIDLSIRLRKNGWKLRYSPQVVAYHARGWARDRQEIPYETRCLASANEMRLNLKHRSPYLIWSLGKYLVVRFLRM